MYRLQTCPKEQKDERNIDTPVQQEDVRICELAHLAVRLFLDL